MPDLVSSSHSLSQPLLPFFPVSTTPSSLQEDKKERNVFFVAANSQSSEMARWQSESAMRIDRGTAVDAQRVHSRRMHFDLLTPNSVTEGLIGRDRSRCLNTRDLSVANLIVRHYLRSGQRLLSKSLLVDCRRGPRLPHAIPPCYYTRGAVLCTVHASGMRE